MNHTRLKIYLAVLIFFIFSIAFYFIHQMPVDDSLKYRQIWGGFYTVMALYGGILGYWVSEQWGGYKSLVGKAMLFLSVGLFLQTFGQISNSYYNVFLHTEVPYPSLGDIGFFGSVLAYIYAAILLFKTTGSRFSMRLIINKIGAIVIPIAILSGSYYLFLKDYEFDWTNKLKIFLDFGYPLGQALYISIALLALLTSWKILGGIMKKPIVFFLIALIFDYLADFVFLFQVSRGTWITGGLDDYLYFFSYFVMAIALIYMGSVFYKVQQT